MMQTDTALQKVYEVPLADTGKTFFEFSPSGDMMVIYLKKAGKLIIYKIEDNDIFALF